jgi:hypothetical protein
VLLPVPAAGRTDSRRSVIAEVLALTEKTASTAGLCTVIETCCHPHVIAKAAQLVLNRLPIDWPTANWGLVSHHITQVRGRSAAQYVDAAPLGRTPPSLPLRDLDPAIPTELLYCVVYSSGTHQHSAQ